ncbi:hypothetical protein AAVH_23408, partial [Aphelenchoides avenae]
KFIGAGTLEQIVPNVAIRTHGSAQPAEPAACKWAVGTPGIEKPFVVDLGDSLGTTTSAKLYEFMNAERKEILRFHSGLHYCGSIFRGHFFYLEIAKLD